MTHLQLRFNHIVVLIDFRDYIGVHGVDGLGADARIILDILHVAADQMLNVAGLSQDRVLVAPQLADDFVGFG